MDSLYTLEHFDDDLNIPHEDDQVMTLCNQCGKVTYVHIELPIPWKSDAMILPDNKYIDESLRKIHPFDRYDVEIKKLLHNGYTVSFPHDDNIHKAGVYLPHH